MQEGIASPENPVEHARLSPSCPTERRPSTPELIATSLTPAVTAAGKEELHHLPYFMHPLKTNSATEREEFHSLFFPISA